MTMIQLKLSEGAALNVRLVKAKYKLTNVDAVNKMLELNSGTL